MATLEAAEYRAALCAGGALYCVYGSSWPVWSKTRNRLDSGGDDPAIARALAGGLPTPSHILMSIEGGTGGGGKPYELQDIARIHHRDYRPETVVARGWRSPAPPSHAMRDGALFAARLTGGAASGTTTRIPRSLRSRVQVRANDRTAAFVAL
jgi:hypothetical protein